MKLFQNFMTAVWVSSLAVKRSLFHFGTRLSLSNLAANDAIFNTPSDPGVDFAIGEDEDAISTAPQTSGHTATGEALRINIPPGRLCVICRETMRPDNILKQLPKCKHVFCAKCIDPWLQLNPRCPLCRRADSAAKRAYIEHESNNPDVASQLNPQVVIRYVEVQVQMQRRRTLLGRCYLSAVVCLLLIIVFQFILQ
ncbi:hypothetical protein PtB15_1B697 [Puccinia triticina]|nr:hypothetical protein PtB15_1B697 [Puccinia triticina]